MPLPARSSAPPCVAEVGFLQQAWRSKRRQSSAGSVSLAKQEALMMVTFDLPLGMEPKTQRAGHSTGMTKYCLGLRSWMARTREAPRQGSS
eukprot:3190781-Prymnesium_polylepis.2